MRATIRQHQRCVPGVVFHRSREKVHAVLCSRGGVDEVPKCAIQLLGHGVKYPINVGESDGNDITILSLRISCARNCRTTFSKISVGRSKRPSGWWRAAIQVRARSVLAGPLCQNRAPPWLNGFGVQTFTFRAKGALPPPSVRHPSYNLPLAMHGYSGKCIGA